MTRDQEIAQTILEQMGGCRLAVLTGAFGFYAIDSGLQFNLKPGAKSGIRKVRIILEPSDTYRVIFYRKTSDPVRPWTEVANVEDVYCDMLQDIFEQHTGLYTTLMARS